MLATRDLISVREVGERWTAGPRPCERLVPLNAVAQAASPPRNGRAPGGDADEQPPALWFCGRRADVDRLDHRLAAAGRPSKVDPNHRAPPVMSWLLRHLAAGSSESVHLITRVSAVNCCPRRSADASCFVAADGDRVLKP